MLTNETQTVPGADFQAARRLFSSVYGKDTDLFDGEGLSRVGDYLLHRRLGGGGAGIAYEGVRLGTQQAVTVKVLRRPIDDERSARHAWRELEMLESVRCPSIPRLHDYGLHEGRLFIAYDYIEGERLTEYCAELDLRDRVRVLVDVARAVQEMHERQILHRDLKPGNILVDADGVPHLIDLGLATESERDAEHSQTEAGRPVGTLAFMAPEQARGERDAISTRTDVFGLGATACQVLTGRPPHDTDGDEATVLHEVAHGTPRRITGDLPGPLVAVLETAMHPEPARRFASAAAFADDLENWLEFRPVRSQRTTWLERRRLDVKRHPRRAGIMATLALIAAAAAIFGVTRQVAAYRALEAKVTAETTLAETTAQLEATDATLATRRDELAQSEARLAKYEELTEFTMREFSLALDRENFRDAFSLSVVLDAALRTGMLADERLRDTDAMLAAIGEGDIADARGIVMDIAASERPRSALLSAFVRSAYPHEEDRAAQIVAWTDDVLDVEDVEAEALLDALEVHIREALERR